MQAINQIYPEKAGVLKQLHHNGTLLVLPNIWDPLGALLLESMGYGAVATASASVALSNGYADGEKIPFNELLAILKRIVNSVKIPVTADVESGYAQDSDTLAENTKRLVDSGIAGINFEDTQGNEINSIDAQCERIRLIRDTAANMGMPLFINARTDVFLSAANLSGEEKLKETIIRGKAYKQAGADCFYPIFVKKEEDINIIIKEVELPVNILLHPGIPDVGSLNRMGVARLSLGPGFLKIAVNSLKNVAEQLLSHKGMEKVNSNPVTSAYLNGLIPGR